MAFFLILLPFMTFATLMHLASPGISLFTSAFVALAIIALEFNRGRSLKMLPLTAVLVFAALGSYVALIDANIGHHWVHVVVDVSLLAFALVSLAIRRPFTLQYARELVDAEIVKTPGFIRANYIITSVWAASFVLMLTADLAMIYTPSAPIWAGLAIAFFARNGAVLFTKWYRAYRIRKYGLANPANTQALS